MDVGESQQDFRDRLRAGIFNLERSEDADDVRSQINLPIRPGDDEIGARGGGEDGDNDDEERGEAERRRHVRRPDRVAGVGFAARWGWT